MKNLIKKSILLGLGAASVTKEKVDKLVGQYVKKKAITKKDGKWIADQVLKQLANNMDRINKMKNVKAGVLRQKAKGIQKKLIKRGRKTAKGILSRASKELR